MYTCRVYTYMFTCVLCIVYIIASVDDVEMMRVSETLLCFSKINGLHYTISTLDTCNICCAERLFFSFLVFLSSFLLC